MTSQKSRTATFLFCLFFGGIGVHRFYAGKVATGVLYLFTLGLLGIGTLIDFIMIAAGVFRDADGNRIDTW